MSTADQYHVGQTVWLHHGHSGVAPQQVEISRVGRTVVGVQIYGREMTFRIADGYDSKHRDTTPGLHAHIVTEERKARNERFIAATKRLREFGIAPADYGSFKQPVETLEALIAVLEAQQPPAEER